MKDLSISVRTATVGAPGSAATGVALTLCIVDEAEARFVPLPARGELVVGRAPEADVRLAERGASRLHARLRIEGDAVLVTDLGSRNGTLVNGAPVRGPVRVAGGDAIGIGSSVLVLRRASATAVKAVCDRRELTQRLDDELARAGRFGRRVVVGVVRSGAEARALAGAFEGLPRPFDVLGSGDGELVVVLADTVAEEAAALADAFAKAALRVDPAARAGFAVAPDDGDRADALVDAARDSAERATPGEARFVRDEDAVVALGETKAIVADAMLRRVYSLLRKLAESDLAVLVQGPTGSGKELVAEALHRWSPRSARSLVALNCAAVPEALIESELFGHERGAFSGAVGAKVGLVESAHRGTLFLDEVAELSLAAQAKLLRFLETGRFLKVGSVREGQADVRIVAASHARLDEAVAAGRFREDLLFRLRAAKVVLPALADRPREIPLFARTFLAAACAKAGRAALELDASAYRALDRYAWPGNVRELRHAMSYVAATAEAAIVGPHALPEAIVPVEVPAEPAEAAAGPGSNRVFRPLEDELRELERTRILQALEATGYVQTRAAELLRMPIRTFTLRLKQYGIDRKPSLRP